jgi:ABC-type Fe3+/spermidine/putrescine transport system ATPase subunit
VLYVTHDQAEAMTLSDRIAVVNQGRFEQVGAPADVYEKPGTPFVADFLGRTIILEGKVIRNRVGCWFELLHDAGRLMLDRDPLPGGSRARLFVRPEDIEIFPSGAPAENEIRGTIEEVAYLGDHFEYNVSAAGKKFMIPAPKRNPYAAGSEVRLRFDPARLDPRPN